jgi:hypothetical protein
MPNAQRGNLGSMNTFEREARAARPGGLGGELWYFLHRTRKWWLAPILVVLLALGVLIILSSTAAAPFIYTLF